MRRLPQSSLPDPTHLAAIPIILFKRRYTTYCVPLVALDAVEKAVMNRRDIKGGRGVEPGSSNPAQGSIQARLPGSD